MTESDSALQDALARVRAFAASLSLPALSNAELQSATFEHYNLSRKGGQARAQDVAGILEGAAREEWIARRELDYLRAGIAASTPQLVELMKETASSAVKAAIFETIYDAIAKAYPALALLTTQVAARKKEELSLSEPPSSTPRKGVMVPLEIEEEPESAAPTLESDSDAPTRQLEATPGISEPRASIEDELRQNLQFLCLCLVNEYLVPRCEKRGIKLSPELQKALLENMLTQAYRTGLHKKVPLELGSGTAGKDPRWQSH